MLKLPRPKRDLSQKAPRFHPRMWALFILIWACVAGIYSYERVKYQARLRQYNAHEPALQAVEQKLMKPVYDLGRPIISPISPYLGRAKSNTAFLREWFARLIAETPLSMRRSISKEAVERLLNNGQPFATKPPPEQEYPLAAGSMVCEVATYTDPEHNMTVNLYFVNGFFESHYRVSPRFARPKQSVWWNELEKWGGCSVKYAPYPWAGILLIVPCLGRYRFLGTEVLTMIALTLLFSHLPSPASDFDWARIRGSKLIPWDLVMVSGSLAALSWAYFSQQARSRIRCPVCDYNLTGNVTGVCSECGSKIPSEIRNRLVSARTCPQLGLSQ